MGIFDFFSSKADKQQLSHIKGLIALAMADGHVDKNELALISEICSREGISERQVQNILNDPESVKFVPPTDHATKVRYLQDMCALMMIDGEISKNEIVVCKVTAEALGFRHEVIDAMVDDIIAGLEAHLANMG